MGLICSFQRQPASKVIRQISALPMRASSLVTSVDDGTTVEFGPDDVGRIPPGHDAWVAGDEHVVALEVKQDVGES